MHFFRFVLKLVYYSVEGGRFQSIYGLERRYRRGQILEQYNGNCPAEILDGWIQSIAEEVQLGYFNTFCISQR